MAWRLPRSSRIGVVALASLFAMGICDEACYPRVAVSVDAIKTPVLHGSGSG
jgi:hypothetical protein